VTAGEDAGHAPEKAATMSFQKRGQTVVAALDPEELKLIYRVLHRQLTARPELIETHFLIELQKFLYAEAQEAHIDVADHAAWDRWLQGRAADSV